MKRQRDEYGQFVPTLPRYREYMSRNGYLELHANRTFWNMDIPEGLCDDDYGYLEELYTDFVGEAIDMFERTTGTKVYLLGRSGRHVCVEDTDENSKRYQYLKKVACELEQDVINRMDKAGKALATIEEGKQELQLI